MIFLASQSPRRQELLQQIGVDFKVLSVDVDESYLPTETPVEYVQRLAAEKARAGWAKVAENQLKPAVVLGADTTVVLEGQVLGKPANQLMGLEMLQSLSGRCHQVFTAIAIVAQGREYFALSESQVRFRQLSVPECERYWATGEPCDKAGAYAVQGLGALFIEHLSGSYSGVMGLPLFETGQLLNEAGYWFALQQVQNHE